MIIGCRSSLTSSSEEFQVCQVENVFSGVRDRRRDIFSGSIVKYSGGGQTQAPW